MVKGALPVKKTIMIAQKIQILVSRISRKTLLSPLCLSGGLPTSTFQAAEDCMLVCFVCFGWNVRRSGLLARVCVDFRRALRLSKAVVASWYYKLISAVL